MANKLKMGKVSTHEIEATLDSLVQKGLVVDTGERRWSARTGTYEIVYAANPALFGKKH